MRRLFTLAIFFSATLLFMVQPLAGKILLPVLGGSPAVWSTCIVFFQARAAAGISLRSCAEHACAAAMAAAAHIGVLVAASVALPLPIEIGEPGGADPRWWLLRTLAGTVGLPFLALSATAPLLQQWFSRTDDPQAKDPVLLCTPRATQDACSGCWDICWWSRPPRRAFSRAAGRWRSGRVAALIAACAYAGV